MPSVGAVSTGGIANGNITVSGLQIEYTVCADDVQQARRDAASATRAGGARASGWQTRSSSSPEEVAGCHPA